MNQFIQSLMNFMNPDLHMTPNPLVNACVFGIVLCATGLSSVLLFCKLILALNSNASIKRKVRNYILVILYCILMALLFFPIYNGLRAVLNPEAYRHVFF